MSDSFATPEDSKRQESLAYCSPWDHKESDITEQVNNNECAWYILPILSQLSYVFTEVRGSKHLFCIPPWTEIFIAMWIQSSKHNHLSGLFLKSKKINALETIKCLKYSNLYSFFNMVASPTDSASMREIQINLG